jgi:hypothetical protein
MAEPYSAREALEHAEHAREALEHEARTLLRFVPVAAAVLAVFAGLSSLYASRLAEDALALKNEAVLAQGRASDAWAQYQAESIKTHLFDLGTFVGSANGAARKALGAKAARYGRLKAPIAAQARRQERERDDALRRSERAAERKGFFDVALAFYEIAIVLASIAAMVKRHWLFALAVAGGLGGLCFTLYGLLR